MSEAGTVRGIRRDVILEACIACMVLVSGLAAELFSTPLSEAEFHRFSANSSTQLFIGRLLSMLIGLPMLLGAFVVARRYLSRTAGWIFVVLVALTPGVGASLVRAVPSFETCIAVTLALGAALLVAPVVRRCAMLMHRQGKVAWGFAAAAGVTSFAWVIVANRFPLLHPDTAQYIGHGFDFFRPYWMPIRPPFYGLFIRIAALDTTLFGVVLAQAGLIAFLTFRFLEAFVPTLTPWLFTVVAVSVGAGTGAAWICSQTTPDVFCCIPIFVPLILCFHPGLTRFERAALSLALAAGIVQHYSFIPLAVSVLVLLNVIRHIEKRRDGTARGTLGFRAWHLHTTLPVLCAVGAVIAYNFSVHRIARIAPVASFFMLARMSEDGVLSEYLATHCRPPASKFCDVRVEGAETVPTFLWRPWGQLNRALRSEPWPMLAADGDELVSGIVTDMPWRLLRTGLGNFWLQTNALEVGEDSADSFILSDASLRLVRRLVPPWEEDLLLRARQFSDDLNLFGWWVSHEIVMLGILGLLLFETLSTTERRVRSSSEMYALLVCLFGLLVNAACTGALSAPNGRYNARLAWILLPCLFVVSSAIRDLVRHAPNAGEGEGREQ